MQLQKKFGVMTAICMVVGTVVGSGLFFKAEVISRITSGNALYGTLSWIIGGVIMLACLLMFAVISANYPDAGGLADYAEKTVSTRYAYYMGWFSATVYYPAMVSVLAYLSARYTLIALNLYEDGGGLCMLLSCIYLVLAFVQNALAPKLAGKFQIAATVIKMIPIILMIILGILQGMKSGVLIQNFSTSAVHNSALLPAVTASAFAYEGWIAVTAIGAELKNSKKNMPAALIGGGSIVIALYVLYYTGISGAITSDILLNYHSEGIQMAFSRILGSEFAGLLTAFVAVSCIGALNGLVLGCSRAMYTLAEREMGPSPQLFSQLDPVCEMPLASCAMGLALSSAWLLLYYGAEVSGTQLFLGFGFDSSELPVITIYAWYIPVFIMFMKKHGKSNIAKNILLPFCAVCACVFMLAAAIYTHNGELVDYLLFVSGIMLWGTVFRKGGRTDRLKIGVSNK